MKILKQVGLLMIGLFIHSSLLAQTQQTENQSTNLNEPPAWEQFQEHFGNALGEMGDAYKDITRPDTDAKGAYDHAVESISEAMLAGDYVPKMVQEAKKAAMSHNALPEDHQVKWKRRNTGGN